MYEAQHDTAVVVLSYNGKDLHRQFFPQLLQEAQGQYDVVLVDNASINDTAAFVAEHFPQVHIETIEVNFGFAHGYSEGLKRIKAKYYILLSADFEITKGWFQPMYRLMERNSMISACQPKIKYYKDKSMFEYAGAGGGFMDRYGYLFCRGRIFFTLEPDQGQYDNTIEVFWASGGCMFVRADDYHAAGGLDDELYAHMEEVDLCWRLKNMGKKIAYCGESTVYHIGGSVISYGSPQKIFYNYRNSLVLLLKNVPTSKLWWLLPFRLILDGLSGARSLVSGNFMEVKTIIKAHWSFFLRFGFWLKRRKQAQALVTQPNMIGLSSKSMIWEYFFKKKTKYSELNLQETILEVKKP